MKFNLKQVILILVVLLVFISFGVLAIYQKKKAENKPEIPEVEIYEEESKVECNLENLVEVEVNGKEKWQEDGRNVQKFEVQIKNNKEEKITNWKLEFLLEQAVGIKSFWNSNVEINSNNIEVLPVNYNLEILPQNSVQFGIIISYDNDIDLNNYKLYSDDKEITLQECVNLEEKVENVDKVNKIDGNTPVGKHGKLSVNGKDLVDQTGNKFLLRGVSTHGIAWYPEYVNEDTFRTLRDDFNANVVRLALYSDKSAGYTKSLHSKIDDGVKYATDLGMYVIIDWHILSDNNPNINKEDAISFFEEMSSKYKDNVNVIYEICNEPNGSTSWKNDIKPYAEELIQVIRKNDTDAIIIVGTPTWCQDVDKVSVDKIENQKNIMYALHFYADTHRDDLRQKLQVALSNNLPVFVSEFGICDASGNGNINISEANKWIEVLKENNISFVCWNLSNKAESSSILASGTTKISNFTNEDLSECGKWLKATLNNIQD